MGLVVIYRSFQLGQRLLDHAAGAGCVQTQESAAAETELTALAEGHAGLRPCPELWRRSSRDRWPPGHWASARGDARRRIRE